MQLEMKWLESKITKNKNNNEIRKIENNLYDSRISFYIYIFILLLLLIVI